MNRTLLSFCAILAIASTPSFSQEACPPLQIERNLQAQISFLSGEGGDLNRAIVQARRDGMQITPADDSNAFICSTLLLSTARATQLFYVLKSRDVWSSTAPQQRVTTIRFLAEIITEYESVIDAFNLRGLSQDSLVNMVAQVVSLASSEIVTRSKIGNDALPLTPFGDGHGVAPVYRVLQKNGRRLEVFEVSYSRDTGLVETISQFSKISFWAKHDVLYLNRMSEEWQKAKINMPVELRVDSENPALEILNSGVSIPIRLRKGFEETDGIQAVQAVYDAIVDLVGSSPFESKDLQIKENSNLLGSNDTEQGDCIIYRSPEDNDLFFRIDLSPLSLSNPTPIGKSRLNEPFLVSQAPFQADKVSIEIEAQDGTRLFEGQNVNKWVGVELDGKTVFLVYSKDTSQTNNYQRFQKVECK